MAQWQEHLLHADIVERWGPVYLRVAPSTLPKGLPMAWKRHVLVVANVTVTSDELLEALSRQSIHAPVAFTVLVPSTRTHGGRAAAAQQLEEGLGRMRSLGLEVEGTVGSGDPMVAIAQAWDPRRYDEIVISTLPTSTSKWLQADLPRRIERHTGALVTHVVAGPPKPQPAMVQVPESEKRGVMTPFSVLSWGGRADDKASRT